MNSNKEGSTQGLPAAAETADAGQPLQPASFDWLSAGQFAFSLLASITLGSISLISSLAVLLGAPPADSPIQQGQLISSLLFAAGLGFAGLLLIPSILHSGKRLFSQRPPALLRWEGMIWMGALFPLPLILGYFLQTGPAWSQYLLPAVHVAANGAGLVWVLNLARRRFPPESAQRNWGAFGAGLALTPAITFVLEVLILVLIGIFWLVLIQSRPGLEEELLYLADYIYNATAQAEIPSRIGEFIARPEVRGTILVYFSLLIPLVEELLKPLAVYFLLGRKLQPWQGFLIGATAGAGYALFENLTIGAGVETWTFVAISRLGTAAIHIFTTGLVGWGLASAWTEKKYPRLVGSYLAAVVLHGAWNGLNILSALADFPSYRAQIPPLLDNFSQFAPAGLVLLALGSLAGLLRANTLLRRAIIAGKNK